MTSWGGGSSSPNKKAKTELGDVRKIGRFTVTTERAIKILIVEQDDDARDVHRTILTSLDVEVVAHTAMNGQEAVNLHRTGESYRAIFMDLEMPVMNGIMATRTLRDMGVRSPIVGMVSTTVNDDDLVRAFEDSGLTECHRLPMNANEFRDILLRVSRRFQN